MLRRQPPSFDGGPFIGTKHALHRPLVGRDSRLSRPVSGRDRPCHGRNPTTVHPPFYPFALQDAQIRDLTAVSMLHAKTLHFDKSPSFSYSWGLEQVAFCFLICCPNMGPGTLYNTNGPHESGLWNLQRLRACGPAQIWDP